jgi:hypothetical protein
MDDDGFDDVLIGAPTYDYGPRDEAAWSPSSARPWGSSGGRPGSSRAISGTASSAPR